MAQYDVVVVGGGPVGSALALALHVANFNVVMLESRTHASEPIGLRPLALSYGSRLIFERLEVWDALAAATPIERIHVSQRGSFGRAVLTAAEAALPALGYVTDYAALVAALDAAVCRAGLKVIRGARVNTLAHDATCARVEFISEAGVDECIASLVVIADGSALAAEVDVRVTDYHQSAVTAFVHTELAHEHTAYERFTSEGPIALLPFEARCALVWTVGSAQADALTQATPREFLTRLQDRFGERLGRFVQVSERAAHDLTLRVAEDTTIGRAILIGNAAQAPHPVAGQGFNLGLRDAWELAGEIRRRSPHDEALPAAYRARRRIDRRGGIAFTDALVRIFSNDIPGLGIARGAGLALLDNLPPVKQFVMRRMVFGSRG
ncbi:MAG TPA: FAD-dependent monooxygenase [Burkholderiales bacterium]|nr:FAD-dependent monooxygenase [Burkholderiales bacterium]